MKLESTSMVIREYAKEFALKGRRKVVPSDSGHSCPHQSRPMGQFESLASAGHQDKGPSHREHEVFNFVEIEINIL